MKEIAYLVGSKTYNMLYHHYPLIFKRLAGCDKYQYHCDKYSGANPNETDFLDLFIDSNYTPQDLYDDLYKITKNQQPGNTGVLKLVDSSRYITRYQFTPIVVLFIVLFWIVVVLSVINMVIYYRNNSSNFKI